MNLFSRTEKEKSDHALAKSKRASRILGDLAGLSLPFKEVEENEIDRHKIIFNLDLYKRSPVRLLEESTTILQKISRLIITVEQRQEFSDLLASYIYPVIVLWYDKYQQEENSLPESKERRHALVASIDAVHQLTTSYKLLFREYYSANKKEFKKNKKRAYYYAARSLEFIRLEQRLRALRYQKLPKVSWQHCNQIFFSLNHHHAITDDYELVGLIGIKKKSDTLRKGGVSNSNVRKLYLSIQLFGLLDVTTWPTRMFHIPDDYLDLLKGDGLKIVDDDGENIKPGFLVTNYKNETSPLFRRNESLVSPLIQIDFTLLFSTLVKDHKEIAKQQFLGLDDENKFSRPLIDINEVDRVPVIELMIMGLSSRDRRQKRHASFDDTGLSVYFGFNDVIRLLNDLINPDQSKVKNDRQFIDTLAMSSALLAEEKNNYMAASWTITNFSAGGLLIHTEETDFSNPIHIDMLVAFTMPDNIVHPIVGFVRRLNRPNSKQVEIAVIRLSNYAEPARVQMQDNLDSTAMEDVILIKDIHGEWNLIIQTNMNYSKGEPLKLIRENGSSIPIRLGDIIYTKKDFKVFGLRSPKLDHGDIN